MSWQKHSCFFPPTPIFFFWGGDTKCFLIFNSQFNILSGLFCFLIRHGKDFYARGLADKGARGSQRYEGPVAVSPQSQRGQRGKTIRRSRGGTWQCSAAPSYIWNLEKDVQRRANLHRKRTVNTKLMPSCFFLEERVEVAGGS